MRFLHTSDWHVGRSVRSHSRDEEHHAALQQVLTHAREQEVDCVLVAGDVFDTSAPSAESERLVYDFFRELHGAGIPAVVIAGNHDHPRRFEAIAPLLRTANIHAVGEPHGPELGGVLELLSRDGRETATIAALPWVQERDLVSFDNLQGGADAPLIEYSERVPSLMGALSRSFRNDRVNVLMAHALINDCLIGPGGGERNLHMSMGIYGVNRQRLPKEAQYTAIGHVHKAQELIKSPAAWYSGSLLQLDFGETEQDKSVNLVELHARQPAVVTKLPIDKGVRRLVDVGSPLKGVALNDLASVADSVGDAWLRVFIDLDMPVANLPALVRETLPNAVHVERVRPRGNDVPVIVTTEGGAPRPEELFAAFHRSNLGRGFEPTADTMKLFRRLLDEVEADASPDA